MQGSGAKVSLELWLHGLYWVFIMLRKDAN